MAAGQGGCRPGAVLGCVVSFPIATAGLTVCLTVRDPSGRTLFEISLAGKGGPGYNFGMNQAVATGSIQTRDACVGVLGRIEQGTSPFGDAVAGWVRYLEGRNRKPRSIASFRGMVEKAARECGWSSPESVTFESVTAWMAGHGWKATTYNRNLSAFRSFTRWLVASDRLGRDPLRMAHNLEADGDFGARAATVEEARAIIRETWLRQQHDGRVRGNPALYWLCLFSMGLRVGEPEQWRWSDLHLEEPIPFIVWRPEINKNRKRQIVPIPAEAAELLRREREGRADSMPVFPIVPSRTSFRAARDRCGISARDARGYGFSPHSARKFLESVLAAKNVQQGMIDRLMRHAGGVSARYFDPSVEEMAAALSLVPPLWPEKIVRTASGVLTPEPKIGMMNLPDGDRAQDQGEMINTTSNPHTAPAAASRLNVANVKADVSAGVACGFEQGSGHISGSPMPRGGSHLTVDRSSPRYIEALELVVMTLLSGAGHEHAG